MSDRSATLRKFSTSGLVLPWFCLAYFESSFCCSDRRFEIFSPDSAKANEMTIFFAKSCLVLPASRFSRRVLIRSRCSFCLEVPYAANVISLIIRGGKVSVASSSVPVVFRASKTSNA